MKVDQENIGFSIVVTSKSKICQALKSIFISESDVEATFTALYPQCPNTVASKERISTRFISDGVVRVYKDDKHTQLDYWILQECKLNTHLEDKFHLAAQFLQSLVYISFSLFDVSIDLPGVQCKGVILNSKYYFGYIALEDIDLVSWAPLWDKYRSIVRPCDAYKYSELLEWAKKHLKFTEYLDLDDFKDIDDNDKNGLFTNIAQIIQN